jgi:hypothetical protein
MGEAPTLGTREADPALSTPKSFIVVRTLFRLGLLLKRRRSALIAG